MEKRTYKEIVASLETHIIYINNHLQNIDSHLERLNSGEGMQNVAIAKNSVRISLIYKIGGSLLAAGGGTALALKLMGVF